jgi:imidazolonepropionase-like amidohydrolase
VVPDLTIHNVTIVSSGLDAPMPSMDVHIHNGRISAIEPTGQSAILAQQRIDGSGKFLMPGMIDGHVHLFQASGLKRRFTQNYAALYAAWQQQAPRSYLYHGFTTLFDLNPDQESIALFESSANHPDVVQCGAVVVSNDFLSLDYGANFFKTFPNYLHDRYQTPSLPAGHDPARHTPQAVVASMAGKPCLKMIYEEALWWTGSERPDYALPSLAIMRELVAAAHQQGMRVLLHATTPKGHRFALEAGVDMVVHGLWEWPGAWNASTMPPEIVELTTQLAKSGIGLQPTMQVIQNDLHTFDPAFLTRLDAVLPAAYLDYLRGDAQPLKAERLKKFYTIAKKVGLQVSDTPNEAELLQKLTTFNQRYHDWVAYFVRQNGQLLFGTDTAVGDLGWGHPPGLNGYMELQSWFKAGVPLRQIFHAATLGNAKALGLAQELGSISQGKRANLLLLQQNPWHSVNAYDSIDTIILHGKPLLRSTLRANQ